MPLSRWGPGPVFIYESIAATRRWQLYALRALFVFGLLAGLALTWFLASLERSYINGNPAGPFTVKDLALLGEVFYIAIATVQLALVLLVAPAATAGSICLDRARGTLTHMCVTDLTNSEIVLGKLAARLLPVLSLVVATIPVLALAGLLGGVIIEAIVSLTLITVTLAVFGCSLAMAISVRAAKTHEVLMAVYGIEAVWVLGPAIWGLLAETGIIPGAPSWFVAINPFVLAWAPYAWPTYLTMGQFAGVLGGTLALSSFLVVYAIFRLRSDLAKRSVRTTRLGSWVAKAHARLTAWRPGPSLDKDPVLWREWRRGRPSRLARVVWVLYITLAVAGTGWGIIEVSENHDRGAQFLEFVNGFQAMFGLLLLSLAAPTVLAEERVRGSLDVLLATPLSTDRIVLSKWWGIYRVVPALALLPAIGAVYIAATEPTLPALRMARAAGHVPIPVDAIDRFAHASLPMAMLLIQGAVVTSVGLALATWIQRVGCAVAVSVVTYALFAFGWPVFIEMEVITGLLSWLGLLQPGGSEQFTQILLFAGCPFGGQFATFATVSMLAEESRGAFYVAEIIMFLATLLVALIVLALTLATFDRCMGRMPERARRVRREPRRRARSQVAHRQTTGFRQAGLAELNA
jgi:ABC-type transport system involved in multi-copper enzyme maturation permease subunit